MFTDKINKIFEDYYGDNIDVVIQSAKGSEYPAQVKVNHEGTASKWMSISVEQLEKLKVIMAEVEESSPGVTDPESRKELANIYRDLRKNNQVKESVGAFNKDDQTNLMDLLFKLEDHLEDRGLEYGVITNTIQELNKIGIR